MLPDKIFLESTFFDKFLWVQKYDPPRLTHILVFKSLFTFDRNGIQTVKPLVWLLLKSPNPICAIKVSKHFHDIIFNLWTHSDAENRILLCSVFARVVSAFELLSATLCLMVDFLPAQVMSSALTWTGWFLCRVLDAPTDWKHSLSQRQFSDNSSHLRSCYVLVTNNDWGI